MVGLGDRRCRYATSATQTGREFYYVQKQSAKMQRPARSPVDAQQEELVLGALQGALKDLGLHLNDRRVGDVFAGQAAT